MDDLSSFVLAGGVPSSGSTLLSTLLDGHPHIFCGPETSVFCHPAIWQDPSRIPPEYASFLGSQRVIPEYIPWGRPDPAALAYYGWTLDGLIGQLAHTKDMVSLVGQFFERTAGPGKRSVVVDKTPQNLYTVDAFLSHNVNTKSILTVRNGPDVVASLIRRGVNPHIAVAVWVFDVSIIWGLVAKYKGSGQVKLVRYEDLVRDPDEVLGELCVFLGVPPDVNAMKGRRYSTRPGRDASLIPNGTNAVSVWRHNPFGVISRASSGGSRVGLDRELDHYLFHAIAEADEVRKYARGVRVVPSSALHENLGYKIRSSAAERMSPRSLLEVGGIMTRYEMFYLGKTRYIANRPKPATSMRRRFRRYAYHALYKGTGLSAWVLQRVQKLVSGGFDVAIKGLGMTVSLARRVVEAYYSGITALQGVLGRVSRYGATRIGRFAARARRVRDHASLKFRGEDRRVRESYSIPVAEYAQVPLPEGTQYDVVGVIAFQGRHDILKIVVEELFRVEGRTIGIVLACSDDQDAVFAERLRSAHAHVAIVMIKNNPLGHKWQSAVDCARMGNPGYLFITGSDDIVSANYISNNLRIMEERALGDIAMAGPRVWYMVDMTHIAAGSQEAWWQISYDNRFHQMPLGAGRIYSRAFLDQVGWQIFDIHLDRLLDDKGYHFVMNSKEAVYNPTLDDGFVLSAKGCWEALNPMKAIFEADSVVAARLDKAQIESIRRTLGPTWESLQACGQGVVTGGHG